MTATTKDVTEPIPSKAHRWNGEWLEIPIYIDVIEDGQKTDLIYLDTVWVRFRDGVVHPDNFIEATHRQPPEFGGLPRPGTALIQSIIDNEFPASDRAMDIARNVRSSCKSP